MEFTNLIGSWFGKNETGDSVMGILCDPTFESGKVDNEKVNDIIATVSFINDAMGKFIENSVIREICDLSTELSKLPGTGVSKVTKLPHSWIVHQVIKDMSYRERLKKCKKIAPSLFNKSINGALGEMGKIRNRVAHDWARGEVVEQQEKGCLTDLLQDYGLGEPFTDINDEYKKFQKLYNSHRDFILTLECKSSSERLGLCSSDTKI